MKIILAPIALMAAMPLFAAEPASGTLSLEQLSLEYLSGPFVNANAAHQSDGGASGPTCLSPVLECDEFALTLDFPEAIEDVYPSAIVRVSWGWEDITGTGLVDFDCWVFDGEGNLQETSGAGSNNPESAGFLLYGGVNNHVLTCVPFFAAGDSFIGRAEVILGDPVELDEESEDGDSTGLTGILVPGSQEPEAEQRSESSNSGSGSLSWALLVFSLLGLRRRAR
ncbi:MAG: MYXO-CTERM sorting domain-containing protein [Oceanococcus sp.]